jgi:hypothetical protein
MRFTVAMLGTLHFLAAAGISCGQTANTSGSSSTDFRIDIDIYQDEQKPPISSVQTIFADGKYIEVDDDRKRVTVVDPGKGFITILDSQNKSRVELNMADLERQLNSVLQAMSDEQRRGLSSDRDPTLEVDNLVVIGNERLRYKFRPITPANPTIATSYGDFANWSVRINALFNKTPPFIRMQLNQLLIDQRQLPAELRRVTVVVPPNEKEPQGKTEEIVARLILKESLSTSDRTRVASVMKSMNEYKWTSEKEFFR